MTLRAGLRERLDYAINPNKKLLWIPGFLRLNSATCSSSFMATLKFKKFVKSIGIIIVLTGVMALLFIGWIQGAILIAVGGVFWVIGHRLKVKPYYHISPVVFCPSCGVSYPVYYYTGEQFLCPSCGYAMTED